MVNQFKQSSAQNFYVKQTGFNFFYKGDLRSDIDQSVFTFNQMHSTLARNFGRVDQIADGVVSIIGLENIMAGEVLLFEDGTEGVALNLDYDSVGAVLFGDGSKIAQDSLVFSSGRILEVPVGFDFMGRVVNALAEPIDKDYPIYSDESRLIESLAPSIIERDPVRQPLETGITAIDALTPIGRGQRQLIIGDRQTGKTSVAIDTILNQQNVALATICVYVAIGQKASSVAETVNFLRERGALEYTIIVAANADEAAPLQYLAPYTGTALAEYFMYQGYDALVVYDDLTKHAAAYRQMSLLLRRPPGREAYPGDVFYLHSRLLERAANLTYHLLPPEKDEDGVYEWHRCVEKGSLTALPIVETQAGDVSAYIPTNVISITDGQIFLSADLFNAGVRPAIDSGISVSRVGSAAQLNCMKSVAGPLKLILAQFAELEVFSQFSSDLDPATQLELDRGLRLREILKQPANSPIPVPEQVSILFLATKTNYFDNIPLHLISDFVGATRLILESRGWNQYVPNPVEDPDTGYRLKKYASWVAGDCSLLSDFELSSLSGKFTKEGWIAGALYTPLEYLHSYETLLNPHRFD